MSKATSEDNHSGVQEGHKSQVPDDEEIQRKRLLIQNTKFKALATWFTKLCKEVENGSSDQYEAPLKNLVKELLNMEYWFLKMDAVKDANKRDQKSYAQKKAEQEVAIVQAQRDIEQRKEELGEARIVRQNNEEYERLREQVMQEQQRSATVTECEQLEADMLRLQAESERLDITADLRRKQFALLLHCMDDLGATLAEEGEASAAETAEAALEDGQGQPMEEG